MAELIPLVYIHTETPEEGIINLGGEKIRIAAAAQREIAHCRPDELDMANVEIYVKEMDIRPLYHPTTQIIPILPDGKILLTDKYLRTRLKREIRGQVYTGAAHIYDFASGGHITMPDLSESDIKTLSIAPETALSCALRELGEELHSRKGEIFSSDGFEYLCVYKYSDEFNRELTYTYIYRLKGGGGDYFVLDDYYDRDGIKRDIELPVFPVTVDELYSMYNGLDKDGCDYTMQIGLQCVLKSGLREILRSIKNISQNYCNL